MRVPTLLSAPAALALTPSLVLAHAGRPPEPHDLATAWSLEAGVLLPLALAGWLYARGVRALWGRAGRGRGIRVWRARCFAGGLAALFVALVTPLDPLGEALFAAHMVQHLLLVLAAAPLLVLGLPVVAWLWALPRRWRLRVGRGWRRRRRLRALAAALTHPAPAWIASAVVLWVWHVPFYYDLAVSNDAVHALEHGSFVVTAVLFWWALASPAGVLARRAQGLGILYLFTHGLQSAFLGVLLALAPRAFYTAHLGTTAAWGLTPLEDQRLAGAIMWMPASALYVAAIGLVLVSWLRAAERRTARREAVVAARAGSASCTPPAA